MKVFPNPVRNGRFTVELGADARITLFDSRGVAVWQQFRKAGKSTIYLPFLAKGLYTLSRGTDRVQVLFL